MLADEPSHDEVEVGGIARVIESTRVVEDVIARAKEHQVGRPAALAGLRHEPLGVIRTHRPLETMQDKKMWNARPNDPHASKGEMVIVRVAHRSMRSCTAGWMRPFFPQMEGDGRREATMRGGTPI